MKYIDGFRDPRAARAMTRRIVSLADELEHQSRPVAIMEVCGTHTMAIARYGIRDILPDRVELVSGPGCPVCVTDSGYIDTAVELARRGAILVTFGDMMHVPGSETSLAACRAAGGHVEICYGPASTLRIARENPDREVVFLAIGFETTICPVTAMLEAAITQNVRNLSLLTAFKVVPPALSALLADPELSIDAFLCPAHVSAIIGARAYEPFAGDGGVPCVVAGFEPLDILLAIAGILEQLRDGEARVENQYSRVVKPEGNRTAQALMARYLEPVNAVWRGIGTIPRSGLGLRADYAPYDAALRHNVEIRPGREPAGCRCGDVIKGKLHPPQCPLFARACTPDSAVGPCMVSSEGSCAAYYKYSRLPPQSPPNG